MNHENRSLQTVGGCALAVCSVSCTLLSGLIFTTFVGRRPIARTAQQHWGANSAGKDEKLRATR